MSPNRDKIFSICDKTMEYMLYTLVFFIPASKSVLEVFATLVIFIWTFKKTIELKDWAIDRARRFAQTSNDLKQFAPVFGGVIIGFVTLLYASVKITIPVISRHTNLNVDPSSLSFILVIAIATVLVMYLAVIIISIAAAKYFDKNLKAAFISFIAISIVTSAFTSQRLVISSGALLFKTMEYALIFVIMAEVMNTRRRLANMMIGICVSSFVICLDGVYQLVTGADFFRKYPLWADLKVSATFQISNNLGAYLTTIAFIPISLVLSNAYNKKTRFLLIFSSAFIVLCLVLTGARGAWLGFLGAFIFAFLFSANRRFLFIFFILFAVVIFAAISGSPVIKEQIKSFASLGVDFSAQDRLLVWKTGWRMFMDRPLFGHGLGTFMSVFERYRPPDYKEIMYAHNCFLQIAAETGIFGLLIFLWFVAGVFRAALLNFVKSNESFVKAFVIGITAGILAYLICSFFDTNLYSLPLAILFWAMAGLAVAKVRTQ